jgi:formamidopyrimidine-DNA glycosylase
MPELPEVETVRLDLKTVLVGKVFKEIVVINFKNIFPSSLIFKKRLLNKKIVDIKRRGKLLIIELDNNSYFLIHLKMTGQLIYENIFGGHSLSDSSQLEAVGGKLPNRFTRAYFSFNDKSVLYFNDLRKFGYLKLVNEAELLSILKQNYGPEPLSKEFSLDYLSSLLKKSQLSIKALLLNQKKIAGLGNIYVDEALFLSNIKPTRKTMSLKKDEIVKLFKVINGLIKKAIKNRGTTFSNFVDGQGNKGNFSYYLKVYGREKLDCFICKSKIQKIKLAGRGTHYCPQCQK